MKSSLFTKFFVLMLVVLSALALISYSRSKNVPIKEECSGSANCNGKKLQSDFIIWESLSKSLLSEASGCDEN